MGWWITLAILILLAILPVGGGIRYDSDGFRAFVKVSFLRIQLFPKEEKPKKEKKPAKVKKTSEEKTEVKSPAGTPNKKPDPPKASTGDKKDTPADKPKEKKGGSLTDFLPLVKLGLDFLGDFRRKIRVDYLKVHVMMASGDPANLAINYGRAWMALGNLLPQLERVFVIKKRDLDIGCDFEGSQTLVTAALDITITIGRLLALVTVYGVRGLIEFLKFRKKRKGGAVK